MPEPTLAEELVKEAEMLRRRFVYHTRPKGPMTLKEAMEFCEQAAVTPDKRREDDVGGGIYD